MNILFVDHECHRKTRSAEFFLDILRTRHAVEVHAYGRYYHCDLPQEKIDWADAIVFWEFLPYRFACGVTGKRCVFVPMFDNEWGSKWLWRRLAMLGMNVISFCRAVGAHARRCGVENVLDVQFAFDPNRYEGMSGNPRVALYWNRGALDLEKVKGMFGPGALDRLIVYDKFVPRDEYLKMIREVGVYVAPRFKEGIGMSFLEPFAMGKCVIAHNEPTMSEYIEDGKNGLLVDMRHPRQITADEIVATRMGVGDSAAALYGRWVIDQKRILDFFDRLDRFGTLRSPWTFGSLIAYAFYWIEGALMRFGFHG